MEIFFQRIKDAAAKGFDKTEKNAFVQWLGSGPSIRVRARLALSVAFLTATANLLVGVIRTVEVTNYAATLGELEDFEADILTALYSVEKTRADLWQFDASPSVDSEGALLSAVDELKRDIASLESRRPKGVNWKLSHRYEEIIGRITQWLDQEEKGGGRRRSERSAAALGLSLGNLVKDLEMVLKEVNVTVDKKRETSRTSLMQIARDQLLLLLVLIFCMPVFLILVPPWVVQPLKRLHGLARRVRDGQVRDFGIVGKDEVSQVSKALKNALKKQSILDGKKSSKIFEIRNVLRAVVSNVEQAIFVLDHQRRVNYATNSAARLFGMEAYQVLGKELHELGTALELENKVSSAFKGEDLNQQLPLPGLLKGALNTVKIGAVHNRDGDISRLVLFFN